MTVRPRTPGDPPVLVVVTDDALRAQVLELLAPMAVSVVAASTAEAEIMLRQESYGVLILTDDQPAETGIMFLARINDHHPWLRRILICGDLDSDLLLFLINEANVFRCITRPIDPAAFQIMITRALTDHLQARRLAQASADHDLLRAELAGPGPRLRRLTTALRHWIAALPRLGMISLLTAAWLFGLGLVVLLALYGLKTILGIDLIEGAHLRDLWR